MSAHKRRKGSSRAASRSRLARLCRELERENLAHARTHLEDLAALRDVFFYFDHPLAQWTHADTEKLNRARAVAGVLKP